MSFVKALQMVLHPNGRHLVDRRVLAELDSDEALQQAIVAERSVTAKARIMLATLDGMSLDPVRIHRMEDALARAGSALIFDLQFDRLSHFVGAFALEIGSRPCEELLQAIHANLASPKYKAASMHRRLHARFVNLERMAAHHADQTYKRLLNEGLLGGHTPQQTRQAREAAEAAFEAQYTARLKQLHDRGRAISRVSAPALESGYVPWVASVLHKVLPTVEELAFA